MNFDEANNKCLGGLVDRVTYFCVGDPCSNPGQGEKKSFKSENFSDPTFLDPGRMKIMGFEVKSLFTSENLYPKIEKPDENKVE